MTEYKVKLEPLCELEAYIMAPIPVGSSSRGTRLIFQVDEGTVKGPKLNGIIRPFGTDYGLIRPDNCFELDVRVVIETDDGAFIYTYYNGIIDMTNEQVEKFLGGELPKGLNLYVTPRFETGHEKYQWMTRIQAIGRGGLEMEVDRIKFKYSWYILTA